MVLSTQQFNHAYWFVDAQGTWDSEEVQHFLNGNCWESEIPLEIIEEVKPGDYIALKTAQSRDEDVSAITILATGVVTKNPGNGTSLQVDWVPLYEEAREWHSKILSPNEKLFKMPVGDWMNNSLVAFAFEEKWHFRNATEFLKYQYRWSEFYQAIAYKLFDHRKDREELVKIAHEITATFHSLPSLYEGSEEEALFPLMDICPFTVMGLFNRDMPDKERQAIANLLADKLGVEERAPASFEGIPIFHHQNCRVFAGIDEREEDDIELLWELYYSALRMCHENAIEDDKKLFAIAFDKLVGRANIGWNITIGLFWIQPWHFLSLDSLTQYYLYGFLDMRIPKTPEGNLCKGDVYLQVMDKLEHYFKHEESAVHSFPELTEHAWLFQSEETSANPKAADIDLGELAALEAIKNGDPNKMDIYWVEPFVEKAGTMPGSEPREDNERSEKTSKKEAAAEEEDPVDLTIKTLGFGNTYSLESIIEDGCFLPIDTLKMYLDRLTTKKNLILQGPPGTGKSWLTKRLAYSLIGYKNPDCLRTVEFHSNISYEDFIRGFRPNNEGRFALADGPFLDMCNLAIANPSTPIVLVIDEINRGNPTAVFGDMMTLLEADKRKKENAIELAYKKEPGEKFYIPENLFIIGSMNIADRSLAAMDIALRRRFAFIELEPTWGEIWQQWVLDKNGIDWETSAEIEKRMKQLNDAIRNDPELGSPFCIGHSYVTPPDYLQIENAISWFVQVARTEIGPLLEEYWFDDKIKAEEELARLVFGLEKDE